MNMAELKMTKARTVGAKRRHKKRGRPCKADVDRTESGQISRSKNPGEAPDVLARRKRVEMYGLHMNDNQRDDLLKNAGIQLMGTVIGRMRLSNEISDVQFRALQRYGELAERYKAIMMVPDSLKKRTGGGVMTIPDDESEVATRGKWRDVTRAITDANTYHTGNLLSALNFMVVRDEFHEHMVGDLRVSANALVRYYGIS